MLSIKLENKEARDEELSLEGVHGAYGAAQERLADKRSKLEAARAHVAALETQVKAGEANLVDLQIEIEAAGGSVADGTRAAERQLEKIRGALPNARGEVARIEGAVALLEKQAESERAKALSAFGAALREKLAPVQARGIAALREALTAAKEEVQLVDSALVEAGQNTNFGRTFPREVGGARRCFGPPDIERLESCLAQVRGQVEGR